MPGTIVSVWGGSAIIGRHEYTLGKEGRNFVNMFDSIGYADSIQLTLNYFRPSTYFL